MAKSNGENGAATEGTAKTMSKSEAVRRAFEKLGLEKMPAEVQKYIKDEFQVDVTANLVSNVKSELTRNRGQTASAAAKANKAKPKAAKPQARADQAPAQAAGNGPSANGNGRSLTGNGSSAGGISLADIETVKQLARRNGADQLHQLIDLLVK